MNHRGRFITVEGIEGVGKSTNIDFMADRLAAAGYEVVRTREPGGTAAAEKIRMLLLDHDEEPVPAMAELLMFFAARSFNLENLIRPALSRGAWVICDRFTDASRAYQGAGRGLPAERIDALVDWVQAGLEPDLTLLLDAPVNVGMRRAADRGGADRMESERRAFYERIREEYLALARRAPARMRVVDASQPLDSVRAAVGRELDRLIAGSKGK